MKSLLIFTVGVVLGVSGTIAFQNPSKVGDAARDGITQMQTQVESARREQCVREFLDSTNCFQRKKAGECDALIVKECGLPQ